MAIYNIYFNARSGPEARPFLAPQTRCRPGSDPITAAIGSSPAAVRGPPAGARSAPTGSEGVLGCDVWDGSCVERSRSLGFEHDHRQTRSSPSYAPHRSCECVRGLDDGCSDAPEREAARPGLEARPSRSSQAGSSGGSNSNRFKVVGRFTIVETRNGRPRARRGMRSSGRGEVGRGPRNATWRIALSTRLRNRHPTSIRRAHPVPSLETPSTST